MKKLKYFDRATKSLFTVFYSFYYVILEFPASEANVFMDKSILCTVSVALFL